MPFIKVADDKYVNSDHVRTVRLTDRSAIITFEPRYTDDNDNLLVIDHAAGLFFLSELDASDMQVFEKPAPPSLETRIAQALRDDYPHGAALGNIVNAIAPELPVTKITDAIDSLLHSHIVIQSNSGLYFHASNIKQNPDPAIAAAAPD